VEQIAEAEVKSFLAATKAKSPVQL